jgi:hypothetical protein
LHIGWIAILAGLVAGALIGMFFYREEWLGGYGSWRRRMLRLTHISLVGTGLLNVAFAVSVEYLQLDSIPYVAAVLFIAGAASMPLVCALSAWRIAFRQLFFIPVLSLIIATAHLVYRGLLP